MAGALVKISQGHFKGYKGRVKEVKGQTVRIELESQMRVVTGKSIYPCNLLCFVGHCN